MDSSRIDVIRTPKRVILGSVENSVSPISPMANLKLLTKVATSLEEENVVQPVEPQSGILMKTPVKHQRQLRSLGYICKKFLDIYRLDMEEGESRQISLGNLTVVLGVEKRRVYDIINIVASLRYASKICKDKYSWFGDQYLIQTLTELRSLAYQRNYHILLQKSLMNDLSFDDIEETGSNDNSFSSNEDTQVFDDNRIGALCQKSIMIFLISQGEGISFKIISEIVLSHRGREYKEDKTGMRRLYDISNVLESLGLIKRCESKHVKRPTFIYSGPTLPPHSSLDEGFNEHINSLEDLSGASSDCELGVDSVMEFLDTDMRELNSLVSSQFEPVDPKPQHIINAKKQLFPDINQNRIPPSYSHQTRVNHNSSLSQQFNSVKTQNTSCGFIRAPQSSFKFTNNGSIKIIKKDSNQNIKKVEPQRILKCHQRTNEFIRISNNKEFVKLSESCGQHSVCKSTPSVWRGSSSIENGAVYRVVKQGNIFNFIQIKSTD